MGWGNIIIRCIIHAGLAKQDRLWRPGLAPLIIGCCPSPVCFASALFQAGSAFQGVRKGKEKETLCEQRRWSQKAGERIAKGIKGPTLPEQ